MSFFHWIASRAIPLLILGGAAFYLLAVNNTIPPNETYVYLGFLAIMLISLFSRSLFAHPAYAPSMLCIFVGLLTYNSWQQNGPHATSTVVLGVLLGILVLINISKFTRSPDI